MKSLFKGMKSSYIILLCSLFALIVGGCTKNEFVGTWLGNNKGLYKHINWMVEIKKDGTFYFQENDPKKNKTYIASGKWELINDNNVLKIPIKQYRVCSGSGIPQLDSSAKEYDTSLTYYLNKEGAFSDSLSELDDTNAVHLKKRNYN